MTSLPCHRGRITHLQRFPFVVHEDKISPSLQALSEAIRQQAAWQHLADEDIQRALRARLVRHEPHTVAGAFNQ